MRNILITGAFGFVGTNLARSLSNQKLLAIDLYNKGLTLYSVFYSWDDLQFIPWHEIDTIIHLAGKAHDTKNNTGRDEYFKINTDLTKKIFDHFLCSEATKFIFFSSVKAAADHVEGILTEDLIPVPCGPYGESKLAAEQYLISEFQRFKDTKIQSLKVSIDPILQPWNTGSLKQTNLEPGTRNLKRLYILRPCMIHGPGNKGNLNQLVRMVKAGIPYPLGAFKNLRSFTSIDNLSFLINGLVSNDIPSGIYNISDDDPVSTNDLVTLIADVIGKKERIWHINRKLINFLAATGSVMHNQFNKNTLQKLTESYIVSSEKIKQALGIESLPIDTVTGLRKTIETLI